jgi:diguanylate cyclase (GGDEF)-like protein/PAS domain S-box-containing protein
MEQGLDLFGSGDPAQADSLEQARDKLALLRQAMALSGEAYVLADPHTGRFLDCSPRAYQQLGYSRQEFVALGATGIQADDQAWLQQQQQRGSFDTQLRARDGRVLDVEVHYQLVSYQGRQLMLALHRDTTQLHQTISKAERLNRLLMEAEKLTQLGSWELIHASGELVWSEGTFLIFETTPEQLQPTYASFLEAVHPDDRELVNQAFQQSLLRREPYQVTHRLQLADGRIKVVEERGMTTFNAAGEPMRSIGTVQDITQVFRYEEELERVAYVDRLTQLPNRQGAIRYLRDQAAVARSPGSPESGLAVFNLDLDQFQALNDTFGPSVGDQLLVHAARVLRAGLPSDSFVARLESDEFVVIQACTAAPRLVEMAQAIQRVLQEDASQDRALPLLPTATIGAAHWPSHGRDPHAILQSANTALVEAKRRGKGQVCPYSSLISERIRERVQLELDLERAIDRHQLGIRFQPQVNGEGQVVGAEVLLRWHHHSGEWVNPDVFIPLAEQSGQIQALGDWVLQETCRQLVRWQQAGWQPPRLAVNISAAQLGADQSGLVQRFIKMVQGYALPADAIEFEITETALIENPERSREDTMALVRAGFRLAIDDFGTGYASLVSLHTLPVHKIKIDTGFVKQIHMPTVHAIVKSTILMARELQLETVAEGVETEEQWAQLKALGCDLFQGYLFGQGMEAGDFRQFVEAARCDQRSTSCQKLQVRPKSSRSRPTKLA